MKNADQHLLYSYTVQKYVVQWIKKTGNVQLCKKQVCTVQSGLATDQCERNSLTMFSLNADQILNSFTTDQEKIYNNKSSLKISVFHYTLNVLFTGL